MRCGVGASSGEMTMLVRRGRCLGLLLLQSARMELGKGKVQAVSPANRASSASQVGSGCRPCLSERASEVVVEGRRSKGGGRVCKCVGCTGARVSRPGSPLSSDRNGFQVVRSRLFRRLRLSGSPHPPVDVDPSLLSRASHSRSQGDRETGSPQTCR